MTKINKILILALVLQSAVLVVTRLASTPKKATVAAKVFNDLSVDDVKGIKIEGEGGKQIDLQLLQKDKWALMSHGGYPVEKKKVNDLLSKFPALTAGDPVTSKKSHHRALEVDNQKFQRKITLTLSNGNKRVFFLGSSPLMRKVHFRFDNQEQVDLVGELSTWDIGSSASDWIDTSYFKTDQANIVSLTLTNPNGQITLNKGADGKWGVMGLKPDQKIKQSEIDSLLSTASSIAMTEPVSKSIQPNYGLQTPQGQLTVFVEEKAKKEAEKEPQGKAATDAGASSPEPAVQRKTLELKIGAKKDDNYYAKSSTSDYVVLIGAWAADNLLKKKTDDFMDKGEGAKDGANANQPPGGMMPPGAMPPGGMMMPGQAPPPSP
jgi:hypothetical protein